MASCKRSKTLVSLVSLCSVAALGGCADYLNHWDSVAFRAGDAVEANTAIQVVDPFPPYADNNNIPTEVFDSPL